MYHRVIADTSSIPKSYLKIVMDYRGYNKINVCILYNPIVFISIKYLYWSICNVN